MSSSASGPRPDDATPSAQDPYGQPPSGLTDPQLSGMTGWERPNDATATSQPSAPASQPSAPTPQPSATEPAATTYSAPANDPWGSQAPAYTDQQPYQASQQYQTGTQYQTAPAFQADAYNRSAPATQQNDGIPPYVPPQQTVGYPYGTTPAAPAPEKPSKLGVIGLALSVAALVISVILSVLTANAYGELFRIMGTTQIDTSDRANLPPGAEPAVMRAGTFVIAQAIPSLLGIAGLICAAMGLAKPGPKLMAALGLGVAILAPLISFGVFMAVMAGQVPTR